jgi:hypothetical protein
MGFVNAINSFVGGGQQFYEKKRELEDRELKNKGERQRQDLLAKRDAREQDLQAARKRLLVGQAEVTHNQVTKGDIDNTIATQTMDSKVALTNAKTQNQLNQAKLANALFEKLYPGGIVGSEAFGVLAETKTFELESALKKAEEEASDTATKLSKALGRALTEPELQVVNQYTAEGVLKKDVGATIHGGAYKRGGSGKVEDKNGSYSTNISALKSAIGAMLDLGTDNPQLAQTKEYRMQVEKLMGQLATETNRVGLEQAVKTVAPVAQTMFGAFMQKAEQFRVADEIHNKALEKKKKEEAERKAREAAEGKHIPLQRMTDWQTETDFGLGISQGPVDMPESERKRRELLAKEEAKEEAERIAREERASEIAKEDEASAKSGDGTDWRRRVNFGLGLAQ